jgi:Tn3 transposase DDE domain
VLDDDPVEMEKHIKFNQLVANCVMFQNVLDMSQAIRELIEDRYPVTVPTVHGLSAYPHEHLLRYGEYDVDLDDIPPPMTEEALNTIFEQILHPELVPLA